MKNVLFLLLMLFCYSIAEAVDVTALPDIGTPTSSSDSFIMYDASAAEGSRITERKMSGVANEFLDGDAAWTLLIPAAGGAFTGNITAEIDHILETGASATLTAAECRGQLYINNDADVVDWTLPTVEEGLNCCFGGDAAGVITVDAAAGDIIILDGTALDAADEINSPGAAGDFICLTGKDATYWRTWGRSGAWVDAGVD